MRKIFCFLLLTILTCFAAEVHSKELKTLVLIIATDDLPAYRELQKIWEAYMNSDPDRFEVYFIRGKPKLKYPWLIKHNDIIVKTAESFVPGILNKTILSLEAMEPRLDEFDYVIRTNLSSFFPFDNLYNYLSTLPRQGCYCGVSLHIPQGQFCPELGVIPFISGAGIILSTDLAKMLIHEHAELEKYKTELPDDVFIGLFYERKKIYSISAQRWDYPTYQSWLDYNHRIEDYAYHFRAKRSYDFRTAKDPYKDELLTLKALLERYYSISL